MENIVKFPEQTANKQKPDFHPGSATSSWKTCLDLTCLEFVFFPIK
jgi:hypothetical protein